MRPEIIEGIQAHLTPVCLNAKIEILEVAPGHVRLSVEIPPEAINMYGGLHGGYLYTLCDVASGMSTYAYEVKNVTQSSNIQYLRVPAITGILYVESKAIKRGRTVIVNQVTISDEQEQLLVTSTFNMFVTGTV